MAGERAAGDALATWAKQHEALDAFAKAVFRRQFADGGDITQRRLLLECVEEVGLNARDAAGAIERPAVKRALRDATDAAWEAGARGVPTLRVGEAIFYGDDQLELAAAAIGET